MRTRLLVLMGVPVLFLAGCTGSGTVGTPRNSPGEDRPAPSRELPHAEVPRPQPGKPKPSSVGSQPGALFGSPVEITIHDPGTSSPSEAIRVAFTEMDRVDAACNPRRPGNEIATIHRDAASKAVSVSPELLAILQRSVSWSQRTGGALDVTVAPLVTFWEDARKRGTPPDPEAFARTRKLVNYAGLSVDPAAGTLRLAEDGMGIDLGALARGHAMDLAAKSLRKSGVLCATISTGGDVCAFGWKPDGKAPKVGILHPFRPSKLLARTELLNAAIATRSTSSQVPGSPSFSTAVVIDPRNGLPIAGPLSVTTRAPKMVDACALAASLLVLGPQEGIPFAQRVPAMDALFLIPTRDEHLRLRVLATQGFETRLEWVSASGTSSERKRDVP